MQDSVEVIGRSLGLNENCIRKGVGACREIAGLPKQEFDLIPIRHANSDSIEIRFRHSWLCRQQREHAERYDASGHRSGDQQKACSRHPPDVTRCGSPRQANEASSTFSSSILPLLLASPYARRGRGCSCRHTNRLYNRLLVTKAGVASCTLPRKSATSY
jgi:hypothetical protein